MTWEITIDESVTEVFIDGAMTEVVVTDDIPGYQPLDADLTAISALATTGLLSRTAAGTYSTRTLTAPAAGITVTNGDGVAGNPTLVLANDLAGVEGLSTTGLATRTADGTWTTRALTGTAAEITVTNGDGVAGAPALSLPTLLTFTGKTVTGGTFASPTLSGTVAGTPTFSGNIAMSGTLAVNSSSFSALNVANGGISCARGIASSGAVAGSVGVLATNTDSGITSSCIVSATNDVGVQTFVGTYSSGNTSTLFGLTRANHGVVVASDADCMGLLIGGLGVNIPIVFGTGSNEWARFAASGGLFTLSTASAGLTIAKTTGTTLVVSSTQASGGTGSGCATFAGGIGVVGAAFVGGGVNLTGGLTLASASSRFINSDSNARSIVLSGGPSSNGAGIVLNGSTASPASTGTLRVNTAEILTWTTTELTILSGVALKLGNAYTAGAPTPTGYITIKDSAGVSYKIPAEAA